MEPEEPITNSAMVDALQRIAKDDPDGVIAPEAVVSTAENPQSPLHSHFCWDDTEAARLYRLVQARSLIRRVVIRREPEASPEFVNVTIQRGDGTMRRGYVPTERAVAETALYRQIVADARRGLEAYRRRLSAFTQAQGVVRAIDHAIRATHETEIEEAA